MKPSDKSRTFKMKFIQRLISRTLQAVKRNESSLRWNQSHSFRKKTKTKQSGHKVIKMERRESKSNARTHTRKAHRHTSLAPRASYGVCARAHVCVRERTESETSFINAESTNQGLALVCDCLASKFKSRLDVSKSFSFYSAAILGVFKSYSQIEPNKCYQHLGGFDTFWENNATPKKHTHFFCPPSFIPYRKPCDPVRFAKWGRMDLYLSTQQLRDNTKKMFLIIYACTQNHSKPRCKVHPSSLRCP